MVPPLPFVLGERSASLWIITEGQWDAVTVFGLLGGFDDQFDLPIAVFGLRGAEAGPSVFLSHYQYLIRRHKPQIWLMPDNDKAGNAWDGRGRASNFAAPQKETFTDTLRRMLPGRRFPVSRAPKQYGTDFNDFYKNGKPSRDMLLRELERHFPSWIQTLTH